MGRWLRPAPLPLREMRLATLTEKSEEVCKMRTEVCKMRDEACDMNSKCGRVNRVEKDPLLLTSIEGGSIADFSRRPLGPPMPKEA